MATAYTWSFPQFDTANSDGGFANVVKTIHWRLDGVDGGYAAGAYGTVGLGDPEAGSFINFDNLTEQWAIDAVSGQIDVVAAKSAIDVEIEAQRNPPIVPKKPPFVGA